MNPRTIHKIKTLTLMTLGGSCVFVGLNIYNGSEKFYNNILMPAIHKTFDPESAHKIAVFISKYDLLPKSRFQDPSSLSTQFLNIKLSNPVGIAAGFDKHGESIKGLTKIGFGFVEVGSITPKQQFGNQQPRVFRLNEDKAVINRYGFNSQGHDRVLERLKEIRNDGFNGIIGINLGKNKDSDDPIADYVDGIKKFGQYADYLVINISSPNTPGLRALQDHENLQILLPAVIATRNNLNINKKPPILLKLAPDLNENQKNLIANVLKKENCQIDGLIISNTTVTRPDLLNDEYKNEIGGLSGQPLKDLSTKMIKDMYKLTDGKIPIIGVGGIFTGEDAYEKIRAGATLIQIYTSFIYHGPPRIDKIKKELADLLTKDGFNSIQEAVGSDCIKSK